VVSVCDHLREGREVSSAEVLKFLNHWLRDHVLGIDQLLGEFLCQAMSDTDGKSDP
jgi:hemerythrin